MSDDEYKSDYAALLSRLSEMQEAYCYAAIKHTLREAETTIVRLEKSLKSEMAGNQLLLDDIKARYDELAECRTDKFSAVEEAVEPLLALLFAVVHGHIGQNADGDEMIRLHPADFKRIKEAVEES